MPDSLDKEGVRKLFARLVAAYRKMNGKGTEIDVLKEKISVLEFELGRTNALDETEQKRLRRIETKLELYKDKLAGLGG